MNLNRLLVIAILVPSVFVVVVLLASFVPHQTGLLTHREEHIGIAVGMVAGIVPFAFFMLRIFRRIEAHIFQQNDTLSRRNTEMEALLELSRAVENSLDLDKVLSASLEVVLTTTSAEAAEVWLLDDQREVLTLRHHWGEASDAFSSITEFQLGQGYPGIVALSGEAIFAHDLPNDERFLRQSVKDAGFQTFFALPLRRGGKTSGVLCVAARDSQSLTSSDELRLLELMADRVAAALENARLHQEVETLAILTERDRLAREMHDGLGQVLGYVNTKAQAVKELLKVGQTDEAIVQMGQLEAAAQETYEDVREAILALRTNSRKRPLLDSLKEYVDRFSDFSGVHTDLCVNGDPVQFNPAVEVQLLRIVQEALANARKHANAQHIVVELSFEPGICHLRVEDDGQGFDPDHVSRGPWPHLGLQSMQERAAAINAKFVLETALGAGTKILVDIPG
ncbi:MAG: GAF domain-containing sensor histidine kinase [Chloroflexi bacterium]|nr:GAF domain-containing sensor histidine kinase [Chloroflexota bacterium]